MTPFSFSVPQNIYFAPGALEKLPELMLGGGFRKALLVSGPRLEKSGLVGRAEALLQAAGLESARFTDVEANPAVNTVEAAAAAFRAAGADCLVALGGGSPIDVAKAAGVLTCRGGALRDYVGKPLPGTITPIIAIPTTAGSGSEVTAFSVITDPVRRYKFSLMGPALLPGQVLLDPCLLESLPAAVAAQTGMDALVHAIEAYLSRFSSPFTDALALQAIEKIGKNLRPFAANRENRAAAGEMLTASCFAGMAFSAARLGNVHAMSHPLSAHYGLAHGLANAVLLPWVLDYNALADQGRYARIYSSLCGRAAPADFRPGMLTAEVRRLLTDLGIPATLDRLGVDESALPELVRDAMESGNILANPRSSTAGDIESLYRLAIHGTETK